MGDGAENCCWRTLLSALRRCHSCFAHGQVRWNWAGVTSCRLVKQRSMATQRRVGKLRASTQIAPDGHAEGFLPHGLARRSPSLEEALDRGPVVVLDVLLDQLGLTQPDQAPQLPPKSRPVIGAGTGPDVAHLME